jgi:predicted small secreted protein
MKKIPILLISLMVIAVGSLSGCIQTQQNWANDASSCCLTSLILIIALLLLYAFLRGGNLRKTNIVTNVESKTDENKRWCPECGRSIPSDARICPYCGKKFNEFF